jgi:hypothetical protein
VKNFLVLIKWLIRWLIIAWVFCVASCVHFVPKSNAWETKTPLGITIKARYAVITQYENHWFSCENVATVYPYRPYKGQLGTCSCLLWNGINWEAIDRIFLLLQEKHGSKADPTTLKVVIRKIDYKCVDEELNSFEMISCIDGYYPSTNVIWIHLGDDSGQGEFPFCGTALSHELNHYILYKMGSSNWMSENPIYDLGIEELCQ